MKRILVTGGAGFVGSHLCERLIQMGHRVIGVDDLSNGDLRNLDSIWDHKDFLFKELDLLDIDSKIAKEDHP